MKRPSLVFRAAKGTVRLFYPKTKIVNEEAFRSESCVYVGNHSQIHGPIVCELFFPEHTRTWCDSGVMDRHLFPDYAMEIFFADKKRTKPFFRAFSHMIAPLAAHLFRQARTLAVFRDRRAIITLRASAKALEESESIVIFPEGDEPHNQILYEFHKSFIDLARLYYKRTGKKLSFVPFYLCPALRQVVLGTPVTFDPERDLDEERERIRRFLMDEITRIAEKLPAHKVVPFKPLAKSEWRSNREG